MKNARGVNRFISFVIDFSILVGLYFLSFKVAEIFVPAKELYPPVGRMQLYSARQQHIYIVAALIGALFYMVYHSLLYWKFDRTIGQLLTKIKRVRSDGGELTNKNKRSVIRWGLLKFSLVLVPAPLFSFLGLFAFPVSIFILFVPLIHVSLSPFLCYSTEDKLSWFELRTKTKIITLQSGSDPRH